MSSSQDEFVIEYVEIVSTFNYGYFSVLAFLAYDTVLLFDKEVKYFLQPPKKALSYLYYTSIPAMPPQKCDLFYLAVLLETISILCIDYILLLRVRALYSGGRTITIILGIAFAIEAIVGVTLGIHGTSTETPQAESLAAGLTYCTANVTSVAWLIVSWAVPLAYGIVLMILAIYKSAKILKEDSGSSTAKIVKIIVRDQVVYFLALILISAGNIMGGLLPVNIPLAVFEGSFGNPVILSSVGARLLLNMKEAGEKGLNEGMGGGASRATVSGMDFAAPPARASDISHEDGEEERDKEIEMTDV